MLTTRGTMFWDDSFDQGFDGNPILGVANWTNLKSNKEMEIKYFLKSISPLIVARVFEQ